MDYKYIAKAEQTIEALDDAATVLEQKEKIEANIKLYNYSLFELNKARENSEVSYNINEKKFIPSKNFSVNWMHKYKLLAK